MRYGPQLTGIRFGRLIVIGVARRDNGVIWSCMCDCGTPTEAKTGHLNAGNKLSCGCAQRDAGAETARLYNHQHTIHGLSHSRLNQTYNNMIARCYSPGRRSYADYGARGISVCNEWRNGRAAFFDWALSSGYADDLEIDRADTDGNYEPGNCRWVTQIEQANNTRRSVFLEWDGRRLTISQWAVALGVLPNAIQHRHKRGWSIERIFTQPFRKSERGDSAKSGQL